MRRLNQLNSTRYHLTATSRIFDWAGNSILIQTSHFTRAELNALIMLNILSSILLVTLILFY